MSTPQDTIIATLTSGLGGMTLFTASESREAPEDGSRFVRVEFPGGTAEQISLGIPGGNRYRDFSVFMLHFAVPRAAGCEAEARALCETAAALFRGKQIGGVDFLAPFPPAEDTGPNGNYYGMSFGTPYQFDRIG